MRLGDTNPIGLFLLQASKAWLTAVTDKNWEASQKTNILEAMSSETFQYGQALLKYLKECNKEEFTKYTLDVHEKEEVDNEYDLLMDSETIDVKLID